MEKTGAFCIFMATFLGCGSPRKSARYTNPSFWTSQTWELDGIGIQDRFPTSIITVQRRNVSLEEDLLVSCLQKSLSISKAAHHIQWIMAIKMWNFLFHLRKPLLSVRTSNSSCLQWELLHLRNFWDAPTELLTAKVATCPSLMMSIIQFQVDPWSYTLPCWLSRLWMENPDMFSWVCPYMNGLQFLIRSMSPLKIPNHQPPHQVTFGETSWVIGKNLPKIITFTSTTLSFQASCDGIIHSAHSLGEANELDVIVVVRLTVLKAVLSKRLLLKDHQKPTEKSPTCFQTN